MKLDAAIEEVARAERELAEELLAVGERHQDEQDIFHLTKTLAKKERSHLDALSEHASRYRASLEGDRRVRADADYGDPALLLLSDLRKLHVLAAGTSLDWVALAQGAQAAKDTDLLSTVTECHDETLQWTTYRLKEAAPQALTS